MVSHNLDFIKNSADYIALIYQNKLFAYGTRDDILKSDDPILQGILSIIVDEQAIVAEEILDTFGKPLLTVLPLEKVISETKDRNRALWHTGSNISKRSSACFSRS